jgi:hypothetical protein
MPKSDPIEVRIGGKAIAKAISRGDRAALDNVSKAIVVCSRIAHYSRARVRKGKYASTPRSYATRPRYMISEGYAELLGQKKRRWESSKAFHAAVIGDPGNVTGGMLKGLQVRNYGAKGAVVEFAGKSMGSRIKARKKGGANQRVTAANKKKALAVFWRLRVNPIQPTDPEVEALGSVTSLLLGEKIAKNFSARPGETVMTGDRLLASLLAADSKNGTPVRL